MSRAEDEATTLRAMWRRQWPPGMCEQPSYPFGESSLVDYVRAWATHRPDHVALIHETMSVSFRELDELSDRVAGWLASVLPGAGARVGIMLPNGPEFMVAFYGVLKARGIVVPVNPGFKHDELDHELADSQPTVLFAREASLDVLGGVASVAEIATIVIVDGGDVAHDRVPGHVAWAEVIASEALVDSKPIDPDAVAVLNYTGGTTGLPKGCAHTHRNMTYTAASAAYAQGIDQPDDVSLVYIPVFWIAGETFGLLLPVFTGTTVILLTRWSADTVLQQIDAHRVTAMLGTVDNYLELLDHPDVGRYDLRSLRTPLAMSFVTKLNKAIRERWKTIAGAGSVLREAGFGMTETHAVDTFTRGFQNNDDDIETRPVFCGVPVPGTEIRIVEFGSGDPLPLGREGELAIRSPSLMAGYWQRPAETTAVVRDGWLHTGDIAQLDECGWMHLLGRRKELIKVNGMSVYPAELELLLGRHPAVAGSGVVGVPCRERGEKAIAFVQLCDDSDPGVDAEALRLWCEERVVRYKVPEIRLVDSLPLTASGKVKRGDLLSMFEQEGVAAELR